MIGLLAMTDENRALTAFPPRSNPMKSSQPLFHPVTEQYGVVRSFYFLFILCYVQPLNDTAFHFSGENSVGKSRDSNIGTPIFPYSELTATTSLAFSMISFSYFIGTSQGYAWCRLEISKNVVLNRIVSLFCRI